MNTYRRLLRARCVRGTILTSGFALMVGFGLLCAPAPAKAQIEIDELEELILSVQVGRYLLSDGVLAYQYQDRYYLPVIALSESFRFFTDPDLSRGAISGWAGTEDNTYTLDTQRGELIVRGRRETLDDTAVLPADLVGTDDIYVQQEVLARIWPINAAVNLPALSLDVLVDEDAAKLPFMQRIERTAKRKMAEARKEIKAAEKAKDFTYIPNPYRPIGKPVVDAETRFGYDTLGKRLINNSTLSGVMDLLWAKADFSASASYNDGLLKGPDTVRLRLERQTTRDQPLPLGLFSVEGGDTRVRHSPLIKGGTSGRGIGASSTDRRRSNEFDVITVEGTGPPGWEVEIYRNTELLEFGVIDARGEYRFEEIQLNFGNNQIRRILYGPQGQIREEVDNYTFGSNMQQPGEFNYSVGIVDAEKDLIRLRDDPGAASRIEGVAFSADAAYGINKFITAYSTLTTLPVKNNLGQDEVRDYATLGTAVSLPFGVTQIEAYKDVSRDSDIDKKGHAVEGRFITDILGFKLNLRGALFRDFESPASGYGNGARDLEGDIRVQRNIQLPFAQLGLNLDYDYNRNIDKTDSESISFRQSLSRGGARLANTIRFNRVNSKLQGVTGQLTASARIKKIRVRSNINYDIDPENRLSSFDGEVRYTPNQKFSAAVNAQHDFLNSVNGAGLQLTYDFDTFLGSLEGRWNEDTDFTFGLRASTSLGPYGSDGRYLMKSQRLTSISPAAARIFMDRDGDGVFSDGDEPVPDAEITVNRRRSRDKSDENGLVTALAGSNIEEADIEIERSTLLDPYHVPQFDGITTTLRPGSMPQFDLPIIETGAVDGTALYDDGRPLQGIRLELVDESGEIVSRTETAFDGFYTFEYVRPGNYIVRADPSYGVNVPPQSVAVASDELFASGIDLKLLEQAVEAEAESGAADQAVPDEAERESGEVAQPNHTTKQDTGTVQPAPLSSSDGGFSATVSRVRIGEHPGHVRLVLDISGPVTYSLSLVDGNADIHVDLPDVSWDAMAIWAGRSTPALSGYRAVSLPGGRGTRLILTAHPGAGIVPGLHGVLPPDGEYGHRLYIDVKPK